MADAAGLCEQAAAEELRVGESGTRDSRLRKGDVRYRHHDGHQQKFPQGKLHHLSSRS
jgi:hypothetical protein